MSLFGSLMGDFDDDLFMGNHMNAMNMQMRSMNRLMNSLMPDPFNMLTPFDHGFQNNAMMERHHGGHAGPSGHVGHGGPMGGLFGFPAMPNMNRLLSADIGSPNGASYCSSSVISMSSGPDGRPQIYQATSSTKSGPGGIRETRKTVQDSAAGVKKMAIGHHIGERAHIIEKEQDLRSGQLEENQEFINLEEEEAEDFDREFTNKARMFARPQEMLTIDSADGAGGSQRHQYALPPQQHRQLPALPAPPTAPQQQHLLHQQQQQQNHNSSPTPNNTSISTSLSSSTMSSPRANASATVVVNHNNNILSTSPRVRAFRSHIAGATPRRPLRTPTSSPLATTPTNHSLSTATSPSVHPHPYNAAAARRNYRSKHSKQHQQPQQQQQQQQRQSETATTQQQDKDTGNN